MEGNNEGLETIQQKMVDCFRAIVSLAHGAEEHARQAEQEACCAVMAKERRGEGVAAIEASKHAAAVQRRLHTAQKYHAALWALTSSTVAEQATAHMRNAEPHMEKLVKAEACATEAADSLTSILGTTAMAHTPRPNATPRHPACQMPPL